MAMNPRLLRPLASGFNPRQIAGLGLWLDAADSSTLTLNGSTVSQWLDKSGSGRHAVMSTAAAQPSATTKTQNGKVVLDFSGTNAMLIHSPAGGVTNTSGAALARNVSGLTIIAIAAFDATANTQFLLNCNIAASQASRAGLVNISGTGIAVGGRRLDADSFASASYTANTNANVLTGILDYANSDAFIYENGSLNGSNTSFQTNGNTSDSDSNSVEVGSTGNGTASRMDGMIGEILVYRRALTTSERLAAERYLGRKWGITVA